jgi:hypothetical protein
MATSRNDIQGFNSGKSLNECINDVMNSDKSRTTKRNELIKLGLHAGDIQYIFSKYNVTVARKGAFDFSKITFGVEIECYNFMRDSLISRGSENGLNIMSREYTHQHTNYFKIVSDSSIEGENSNEVVSPVLKGKKGLSDLETLCKSLEEIGARVNKSCGLHVHIGAASMSDEHYCRLVRNYQKLENAIDSFMAYSRRGNNSRWCRSLQDHNFAACTTKSDIACELRFDRYHKVNAEAYSRHRTIEFRQHQGTTNYEKISRWVMFLAKLVEYSYKEELTRSVMCIEDIPFLTDEEKVYFTDRRNQFDVALASRYREAL